MKKIQFLFSIIFTLLIYSQTYTQIYLTASSGTISGNYSTLKSAFDAINLGTHQGAISIQISGTITETATAKLNASGSANSNYTAISIQPAPNNHAVVTGNINGKLIEFNGADNVTINGFNTTGNSLTIENTYIGSSSSLCSVFFGNDASNNTITKSILKGACSNSGIIFISNGVLTGNDNNVISDCQITNSTSTHYYSGIYLNSLSGKENSNFIISNNLIDNSTWGIYMNGNNEDGIITGNKIFQSTNRSVSSSDFGGIYNNKGDRATINNNYIGSSSSIYSGYTQITGTNHITYSGIKITNTLNGKVNLNNNKIGKIILTSQSSTSTIRGIDIVNGSFNIGTTGGNTIGEFNSDSSMVVYGTTINIIGINLSSTLTTDISNNIMGGFLAIPRTSNDRGTLNGVLVTSQKDSLNIYNNVIGNNNIPHSLKIGNYNLSGKGSECIGIKLNSSSPTNNNTFFCNIFQNTIQNLECYGTNINGRIYGVYYSDSYTLPEGLININKNTIRNLSTNADDSTPSGTSLVTVAAGIYVYSTSRPNNISENTINNLNALRDAPVATVATGILVSHTSNSLISKNTIYTVNNSAQMTNTNLEPLSVGIYLIDNSGQFEASNNMISLQGLGNKKIIGIFYKKPTTNNFAKFLNNTINIFGYTPTGSFPTFCLLVKSSFPDTILSNFEIKNNIFSNTRIGGTGNHYAIGSDCPVSEFKLSKWQPGACDNNVLNANTNTIGFYLIPHTFSSWKSVFSNDIKSYSGLPINFVNEQLADLHLIPSGPSSLESGGIPLANVTTDIDGNIRPGPNGSLNGGATHPDLGADEFDGFPPPSMTYSYSSTEQITGSAFIGKSNQSIIRIKVTTQNRYLPLKLTSLTLNALGTTNINDINVTNAKVYYTAGSQIFDTTFFFGEAQASLTNFNITGNQILEEGDNYFWLTFDVTSSAIDGSLIDAQCTQITLNNTYFPLVSNPAGSKIVRGPMKGTYLIGEGLTDPNFQNITTALNNINNRGVYGSVQFELMDSIYSTNETFPFVLEEIPGASSINNIKLIPYLNKKVLIRGSSPNLEALFKLRGSDYITIDGSNGPNSSLSFENTSTNQVSAVIWLISLGIGNGASNNTIKNCHISAGLPINITTGTSYGIIASGNNLAKFPTQITGGYDNHNCEFINNEIIKVTYGIYFIGGDYNNLSSNITIKENKIGPALFSDNHIGICGIASAYIENLIISENQIKSIGGDFKNIKTSWTRSGISLSHGVEFNPAFTKIKSARISNNIIENVIDERENSAFGIQIGCKRNSDSTRIIVNNNSISNVKSNNSSSNITAGIIYLNGFFDTIAFNSINMFGDSDPDPSTYASGAPRFGLFIGTPGTFVDTFNLVIANNNIVNEIYSSSNANLSNVGIGIQGPYIWQTGYSNNNNYYLDFTRTHSYLGSIETGGPNYFPIRYKSLQSWSLATYLDSNSRSIKPIFNSSYDLHLVAESNPYLNNRGIGLAGIDKDIDSELRNILNPDIGIDEYTPPGCSAQPGQGEFFAPYDSICSGMTYFLNPTGLTQEAGVVYQWKSGPAGGPYQPIIGATTSSYTTAELSAGIYHFVIESTCINTGSTNQSSEFKLIVHQKPSLSLSPSGNHILCGDETIHFEATSDIGNSYIWKKDGVVLQGQNNSTYHASIPGTYSIIVSVSSTTCKDSSSSIILNRIPAPDSIYLNNVYLDICHDTILPLIAVGGNVSLQNKIGDDTLSNTVSTPYKGSLGGSKIQYIINSAELLSSGISTLDTLNGITLKLLEFEGPFTFENFTIGIKNFSLNQLTSSFETGLTTVLEPMDFSLNSNGSQMTSHPFDHPFMWDGNSNILIEFCFNNNNSGGTSGNSANIESSLTSNPNTVLYYSENSDPQLCSAITGGTLTNLRPNFILNLKKDLVKSWLPLSGLFIDQAASVPYSGDDRDTVFAKATSSIDYSVSTNYLSCTSETTCIINITLNEVLNSSDAGPGSLRRAIECSENNDTIHISLPTIEEIELLSKIVIAKQISILDDYGAPVELYFNYDSPLLQNELNGSLIINENCKLMIENVDIQQNGDTAYHPCIVNHGNLIIKNCSIRSIPGSSLPILIINKNGGELITEGTNTIK